MRVGRLGWACDLNKDTKNYWPEKDLFNRAYKESEFTIDQPYDFDIVRAGISRNQLTDLISSGIDAGDISKARQKWILNELEFIESLTSFADIHA